MRWSDHHIGPAFCNKRSQKAPFSQIFISAVLFLSGFFIVKIKQLPLLKTHFTHCDTDFL